MRVHILPIAFLILSPAPAQDGDWSAVMKLNPGTRVEVIHHGLQQALGTVDSATQSTFSIRDKGAVTSFAKEHVTRITTRGGSRKKHALLGAVTGAGAAGAITVAADPKEKGTGADIFPGVPLVAVAVAVGAGAGAGIGAALPAGRTVYRAPLQTLPPPPSGSKPRTPR